MQYLEISALLLLSIYYQLESYYLFCKLIPSRETMIAMVVANYITPDNLYGANGKHQT